jgi:hypothetical protein
MLNTFFDFKLASYESLQDVVLEEILQADLITIREYVKGGIYHSQSMQWVGSLKGIESPKQFIRSKKERKVIDENKVWFEKKGYRFEIVKMTRALFIEFYTLYQETTLQRERPLHFSLKEQILGKVFIEMPVYLIGMFKKDKLESGLVFSVSDDNHAVVSFGAKKKFDERRGGVGGVLELLLIEYCLEQGITHISHGKSPNPAGITSKAGVFEFKARYGFSAFPSGYWKTTFIVNPKVALSDLVFVTMFNDQIGYVVVSDNKLETIQKKYQTREVSRIKTLSIQDVEKASKKFIRMVERQGT